ncbi:MAG: hypothetical protein E7647_08790 [Ruminococcaceae bacterium]|nr:hypothetical protein [Oscillospiraceae bacterium]
MGEYVYTLICAAICTAVLLALSPEGDGGKTGKYVAFVGALVIAVTMLAPIPGILSEAETDSFDELIPKPQSAVSESGRYYANGAATVLCEMYGIKRQAITARVTESDSGETEKITLIIKDEVTFSTKEAGKLLSQIFEKEIEVMAEGG